MSEKQWVPLTDDDRRQAFESLPNMLDGFLKHWGWLHFAKEIERRCKEKNEAPLCMCQKYPEETCGSGCIKRLRDAVHAAGLDPDTFPTGMVVGGLID